MIEHKATVLNFLYLPFTIMLDAADINQFMILGWIIIIDFMTGVGKSIVLRIPITKKKAIDGIIFKSIILLIPLVIALVAKGLGFDVKDYVYWIVSLLIVAEAYGVFGNILSIRNKKLIEDQDVVNIILNGIRNLIIKYVNKNFKE